MALLSGYRLPGSLGPAAMLNIQKAGWGDVLAVFRGALAHYMGLFASGDGFGFLLPPSLQGRRWLELWLLLLLSQGNFITAGAWRSFSHSQIHKAMSNHLRPF